MKTMNADLLTAGSIAKKLGVPGTQVKKALKDLSIKPAAKKGACSYYSEDVVAKLKTALR